FFMTFTHDVVIERKSLFTENCRKGFRYETYICKECLEESLDKNIGTKAQAASMHKVELFARYFANAVSASLKFPDQHIHKVVKRCTYFQFQIQDAEGKNPKVSFTSDKRHYYGKEWESLNIEGFLSNAPGITDLFFSEVDKYRVATEGTREFNTPEGFCAYIRGVFDYHGVKNLFDVALAQLMDVQGMNLH
ncbi:MAG: hypothetical protein KKF12_03560, partial [Proteobacteria bacterium]|nr:hypothetical protein [Pseudomonadota bacterium]